MDPRHLRRSVRRGLGRRSAGQIRSSSSAISLRSSSPNQTSLVLSLRRPRLTPRLNAPDACRQPISVGHQYAKSSSSMIVRKLGGARTSSTTTTSPGHSAANSVSAATDATKPPRRSRLYPSTDSGTIAEMDARSRPGLNDPFEEAIDDALSSLPADLRAAMSNVEIVVDDEPPDGQPLLGLYRGAPLPRRRQHVQRSASRQDQHLPRADHATRCRRRRSSTPRGQARRAPRDRASLRDQRRAVDRARSLLTWC